MKKEPYVIIKQTLPKEISTLCYEYMLFKRDITTYLTNDKYFPPLDQTFGLFSDNQIDNAFCTYGDILMDLLLQKVKPIVEQFTGLQLVETYSYARVYQTGNELKRHVDRESCEVSATLNLGGAPWPIFIDGSGKENQPGVSYTLNPGDMLVYDGSKLEHWREPFKGKICGQVFFHYNDLNSKLFKPHKYDGRDMLGLPPYYRKDRPND